METLILLKANIRHKKGSFISVLLLILIISTSFITIISLKQNIENRIKEAQDTTKVGDFTVFIQDIKCTEDMIQKIKDNKEVENVTVTPAITASLTVNGKKRGSDNFFEKYDAKDFPYQVYSASGMSFEQNPKGLEPGEIYVPISYKRLYDANIGDKVVFSYSGKELSFSIKGFIEEPFIGAELIGIKIAFMNPHDYEEIYKQRTTSNSDEIKDALYVCNLVSIHQKSDSTLSINEFKKSVNAESHIVDYGALSLSKEQSVAYTLMFTQIVSGILYAFIILLFLVVLIVIGHSISTGIEMDYVNLGVLKSQGFTKNGLRKIFVGQYLLAEIIGSGMGALLSIPAIYLLNGIFVPLTGLLASPQIAFLPSAVLLLTILLISSLFVIQKTRKISEISPVRAIAGGREPVHFHSRIELSVDGNLLNFKLAFRQLTSNIRQYISAGFIVMILVFFMITVTVLNSSIDKKTVEEMFGEVSTDLSVYYSNQDRKEKIEAEIEKISEITNRIVQEGQYITVDGDEYFGVVLNDANLFKSVLKGRVPLYDNEIVITEIVAQEIKKSVGDTVKLRFEDKTQEYIIAGIYQNISDVGKNFGITVEAVRRIMPDFKSMSTYYQLKDPSKTEQIVNILNQKYKEVITVKDEHSGDSFDETIIWAIQMMTYLIYSISVIFVLVVVIMICGRIFLKEQKDYGIFKANGFTTTSLRLQFAFRFFIVASIGSMFGILVNILFNDKMMSALLKNMGITSYVTNYSLPGILLPSILISVCFFVFAYLVAGKIKRVDTKNLITE